MRKKTPKRDHRQKSFSRKDDESRGKKTRKRKENSREKKGNHQASQTGRHHK